MAYRSKYKIPGGEKLVPAEPAIFCDVEVRELAPNYRSTFAKDDLPVGTVLFRDGGVVVSSIEDVLPELKYAVVVDEGVWLAPRDYDNMDATCFLNHHCESNVARIGASIYIAKKDIKAGDELTLDYAGLIVDFEN